MSKWKIYLPAIILAFSGLGLILYGLKDILIPQPPEVEIIKAEDISPSPTTLPMIVVDVAGAVEKPGVYTLPTGARVSDALVSAGGLSSSADKNYLARHINLASILADGSKIYILRKGEVVEPPTPPSTSTFLGSTATPAKGLININTATEKELESLWGIGAVRAKSIYDHRPYTNLEELKTKADIPENVFEKIKSEITY